MNTMENDKYGKFRDASTINQMYIVQRCTFAKNLSEVKKFTGRDSALLSLDYMGAAEYEYGAVPGSFARIMAGMDDAAYDIQELKFNGVPVKTTRGVPVWVFGKSVQIPDIYKELELFIKEYEPKLIPQYRLHEWISFPYIINVPDSELFNGSDNCWWDLRNDFIWFLGAIDRKNAFMQCINNEHEYWWKNLSEEDRKERIEKSHSIW